MGVSLKGFKFRLSSEFKLVWFANELIRYWLKTLILLRKKSVQCQQFDLIV